MTSQLVAIKVNNYSVTFNTCNYDVKKRRSQKYYFCVNVDEVCRIYMQLG